MIRSVRLSVVWLFVAVSAAHAQTGVALSGIVMDSSRAAIFGATVTIVGTELSARTDPDGFFRIVGVERAPHALSVSQLGFASRVFRFDLSDTQGSAIDLGVIELLPAVGEVHIRGVVIDSTTGEPILAALIVIDSVARGATDMRGYFAIDDVSRDAEVLEIRRIGYTQSSYDLWIGGQDSLALQVRLDRLPVRMAEIIVVDSNRTFTTYNHDLQGFYERRRTGLGRYITQFDIERRDPTYLSQMLVGMAGLQVRPDGTITAGGIRRTGCRDFRIFIDGVPMFGGSLDQMIRPTEVAGVEIYRGWAQIPSRFSFRGGGCAIVVWTK